MASNTILIVEDDPALASMLRFLFEKNAFKVILAGNTNEADKQLNSQTIDVILLDWMLPGRAGVNYAQILKSQSDTRDTGVIMLTAKGDEGSKIQGLDNGADDYITKPFSNKELLARVRAVLRRSKSQQTGENIQYKNIFIDPLAYILRIDGVQIDIGRKEFQLLYLFLRKPDRVYSRNQLLDQVWGINSFIDDRTVDVYIRRLRIILKNQGHTSLIKTIRGVGYRLHYNSKHE